ncbi:MAG: hypothetical protein NTZ74_03460 [Chloroflexi bacterium]|nr:hypothetical protein [Chloroflexota bacterium]
MKETNPTEIVFPQDAERIPETSKSKNLLWWVILIVVFIISLIITAIVLLSNAPSNTTSKIRDIFIIFLAFESIVIGVALVVLVIQLSTLINLFQNEIKPILKSTVETVDTLKGTTQFLTANLVEPVIKLNGYMAGMKRLFDLLNLTKK